MEIKVTKVIPDEIKDLRIMFLQENNFQFVHNKCHEYGWSDVYVFLVDGRRAGYGSVWGRNRRQDRDAIFEFYLLPHFCGSAGLIFPVFHRQCGAIYMESQSNDLFTSPMLFEFARNINAEAILFEDSYQTDLHIPGTALRLRTEDDKLNDEAGNYVLICNDKIVADGGLMLNYNKPYADIYMKVNEEERRRGFGSLVVQELKKEAYRMGRVPAARCNVKNPISKATLQKAGFKICGYLLYGDLPPAL